MNLDDDLNLKQLIARCDDLEAGLMINVYYTPDTHWFYTRFCDVLPLFVPDNAYFIGECSADNVIYIIEQFLADSIYKFNRTL